MKTDLQKTLDEIEELKAQMIEIRDWCEEAWKKYDKLRMNKGVHSDTVAFTFTEIDKRERRIRSMSYRMVKLYKKRDNYS